MQVETRHFQVGHGENAHIQAAVIQLTTGSPHRSGDQGVLDHLAVGHQVRDQQDRDQQEDGDAAGDEADQQQFSGAAHSGPFDTGRPTGDRSGSRYGGGSPSAGE